MVTREGEGQMKKYMLMTSRERSATIDGLNLFFGALLGANLGTLNTVEMDDYIQFVLLLAGTVLALRFVSLSDRRGYAIGLLAFYGGLIVLMFVIPGFEPEGLSRADFHRTLATLAIWVGSVLMTELMPTCDTDADRAGEKATEPV